MLKLRVVLSFAVAVLVTLDNVAAQTLDQPSQADDEPSYSGSGDTYDAGGTAEPVVEEPPPEYDYTPSSTKATPIKTSSGSGTSGGETVPRWGPCDDNVKCVKHTYCKLLSSGMSICYPA